jgi:hypothetical protein
MWVKTLGVFHLIHCPVLIVLPFFIETATFDILYINYFFIVLFLYTFLNGDCPISYVCKKCIDDNYVAGDDITYYPEMYFLLQEKVYVSWFFTITTGFYLFSLLYVIQRSAISLFDLLFTLFILFVYFLSIRGLIFHKKDKYFLLFQSFTKLVLLITILFVCM